MLRIYTLSNARFVTIDPSEGAAFPSDMVWVDLFNPTAEEERLAEGQLGLFLPTREEMQEIEASSRLYQEDGGMFMTASVLYATETDAPGTAPITFVLKGQTLITIRYAEPKSLAGFIAHAERQPMLCPSGSATLIGLLEAIVDRTADILERVAGEVDVLSQRIFKVHEAVHKRTTNEELEANLKQIGRSQNLVSKARESLVSLARLLSFLAVGDATKDKVFRTHLKSLSRDVASLTDHATLYRQQHHLPARRLDGNDQHRAERHHQDLLGRRGGVPAADAGGQHLRHELRDDAGAEMGGRLSFRPLSDGRCPPCCPISGSSGRGGCRADASGLGCIYTYILMLRTGRPSLPETRIAKLFRNGASQAVRLPAEFRFDGDEVYATRDERTGDVVLSKLPRRPQLGRVLRVDAVDRGAGRLHGRAPMNVLPQERDLFGEEGS